MSKTYVLLTSSESLDKSQGSVFLPCALVELICRPLHHLPASSREHEPPGEPIKVFILPRPFVHLRVRGFITLPSHGLAAALLPRSLSFSALFPHGRTSSKVGQIWRVICPNVAKWTNGQENSEGAY